MENNRSFEEIYEVLAKHDFSALERSRKAACRTGTSVKMTSCLVALASVCIPICLIALFAYGGVSARSNPKTKVFLFLMIVSVIVVALRFLHVKERKSKEKQYRKMYASELNSIFLNLVEPGFSYDSKRGFPEKSYKLIQFGTYDKYEADGLIFGKLRNGCPFRAGPVTTRSTYEESDGVRAERIDFDGILYEIELPFNLNGKLYLRSDKKMDHAGFLRKMFSPDVRLTNLKVKMDSEEFERIFDVYAENKMIAMQLFTADVMLDLERLYAVASNQFEITIDHDMLYISFATGAIFRAPEDLSIPVSDEKTLAQYYKRFENTLKFVEKFVGTIEESNVV